MPIKNIEKKPIVIEAIQWTGDNLREVIDFTGLHPSARKWTWEKFENVVRKDGLKIFTPKGARRANIGDYIVKVEDGFYLCKPSVFKKLISCNEQKFSKIAC